jgi:SEC-C motif-containing protein
MSFGAAASGPGSNAGFVTVGDQAACPCGSGELFGGCCAPLLRGAPAASAERLMRSRYAAFVVGDSRHLHHTWHPGTRPETLELDPALRWTGLEILVVVGGIEGDTRGAVEFRARWRDATGTGELHERSRFVNQSGRWWYLDGTVS